MSKSKSGKKSKDRDRDADKKKLRPGDPYYYDPAIEMDEERIEEYREAFSCFDNTDDGIIKIKFFGSILKLLGMESSELKDHVNRQRIDHPYATLTFEEFLNIMLKHGKEDFTEDIVRDAFKMFDPRRTGYVHSSKLVEMLRINCSDMPEEEIERLVKETKPDAEGNIKYEEFVKKISVPRKETRSFTQRSNNSSGIQSMTL